MYDCWNEAISYLCNKYGTRDTIIGGRSNLQGVAQTYKKDATIIDGKSVNFSNHDDNVIDCLLGQYCYGISAKKELYYKLINMGIIKENLVVSN